jgi:hypothetical protein
VPPSLCEKGFEFYLFANNSATSQSSAAATFDSQPTVGETSPFITPKKVDRLTPARSGRCVIRTSAAFARARMLRAIRR